jgi:hypothetical protein
MKTRRILLTALLVLLVAAVAAGTCFAQGQAQEMKKEAPLTTLQGRIEYMDWLGGYYVRGVRPGGEWRILNQNPEVLKGYMESKKTLKIEGILSGPERITIKKIDGKEYTGTAPSK